MVHEIIRLESALSETRRKWAEELKDIDLKDLKRVRTFSKGSYSHVSLVQLDGHPEVSFALKAMQKAKLKSKHARKMVLTEKQILNEVESDFIVKMYKTFKDKKYVYILEEYCSGGDFSRPARFPEDAAKFYVACVVEALDALHSMNIAHNDINASNLVLGEDGYVKVIDMGLCEKLEWGQLAYTIRGTLEYMAPEISRAMALKSEKLATGRDRSADLWALGVLLYRFLTGRTPFRLCGEKVPRICSNIDRGIVAARFPQRYFSGETKNFIQELCAEEPTKRLGYQSIEDIRKHRWFENFDWASLRNRQLQPPEVPKVESATDTHNFKADVSSDTDADTDDSDWDIDF